MFDSATVTCPYCFEEVELTVEVDVEGSFVQDCEVCCNPWSVFVSRDEEGELQATVDRAQ
jgi:hypothetical protein